MRFSENEKISELPNSANSKLGINFESQEIKEIPVMIDLRPPDEKFKHEICFDSEGNPVEMPFFNNSITYPLPIEGQVELTDKHGLFPLRTKSLELANKYFSKTSSIREFHSVYGVESVLLLLASKRELTDGDKLILSSVGLLHDIGRVVIDQERVEGIYQGLDGRQFTILNSREHPNISAKYLMDEHVFDDPNFIWGQLLSETSKKRIMDAIFRAVLLHGDINLPSDYEGIDVLKMLKDADKIENLMQMAQVLKNDVFYDNKITSSFVSRLRQDKSITPAVMSQFERGELINVNNMNTRIDNLIGYLAWHGDFQFNESLQLARSTKFSELAVKFLKKIISGKESEKVAVIFDELTKHH